MFKDICKEEKLLQFFSNVEKDFFNLSVSQSGLKVFSSLCDDKHEYIYAPTKLAVKSKAGTSVSLALLAGAGLSISGVIIFYDDSENRVGGKIFTNNQLDVVEVPASAVTARIGVRIHGAGSCDILDFFIGDFDGANRLINKRSSLTFDTFFPREAVSYKTSRPLVFIETVFCDTEQRIAVIDRYMSFFYGTIKSISRQYYDNFIWIIHISSDKGDFIQRISMAVSLMGIGSKVIINIYDHPEKGYENAGETHIDRLLRPNTTISYRREFLFRKAICENQLQGLVDQANLLIIRLGLDDDDFLLPGHLETLVCEVEKKNKYARDCKRKLIFTSRRIYVTHFYPDGSVEIYDVTFDRYMTGCKCSVAKGGFPDSPFSISEKLEDISKTKNIVVETGSLKANFSYNRHGVNLSNQSKKYFYRQIHACHTFSSVRSALSFLGLIDSDIIIS